MKIVLIVAAAVAALVVLTVAAIFVASESGEVVVLRTWDPAGAAHETRVWVVEDAGHLWLRAGVPSNAWYQRLRTRDEIEIVRDGTTRAYRAVALDDAAARTRIHQLMAAKYGAADRFIALLRDGNSSIAVRLDPR